MNDLDLGNNTPSLTAIGLLLPEVTGIESSQTTSLTFQPQRDNGLVLIVTEANSSSSLFAVGIFNGQVELSSCIPE